MKINRTTAALLGLALAVLFGLAGWGQHLHMDPEILSAVRTGAAAVFSIALAVCGPLLRKDEDGDGIPDILQRILGLVLAFALFAGCGAQGALSAQARTLVQTQPVRFEAYAILDRRCQERATFPEYRECMIPARAVATAADAYRDSLMLAQASINAGQDPARVVACSVEAAREFMEALQGAGLDVPAEVSQVAAMIPEGVCR